VSNKFVLRRVAGILAAHPGLKVQVEGHTDSTGSEDFNQVLSERRSNAVRDYLIQQGVNPASITAAGVGEGLPVASNDTAVGRQMNRRVEMIVSGDIIGTPTSARGPTTSLK
jgi:outer membrane protein OmpA-like peptidoglycan-associated protein